MNDILIASIMPIGMGIAMLAVRAITDRPLSKFSDLRNDIKTLETELADAQELKRLERERDELQRRLDAFYTEEQPTRQLKTPTVLTGGGCFMVTGTDGVARPHSGIKSMINYYDDHKGDTVRMTTYEITKVTRCHDRVDEHYNGFDLDYEYIGEHFLVALVNVDNPFDSIVKRVEAEVFNAEVFYIGRKVVLSDS